MPPPNTAAAIDRTIRGELESLRKPGVLTVRPGYEIAGHQLTGRPAIVATVHTKKARLPRGDMLPEAVDGVPVDVREATPHQRLRAHDPAAAVLTQTYGRPETIEPIWPYEREMPTGRLLTSSQSVTQKSLTRGTSVQPAASRALKAHSTKTQIPYTPPPAVSLGPISTTTTITAHVSPDAGLATLQGFLGGTRQSLVIGMYDFTSGPILKTFESVLDGAKSLQMVLDNPAPNPTRDQTDTETVEELDQSLGSRAHIVRALDRADSYAAAWIFPYAYHIKVIVRDNTAFWLSSGNLNNSNQPDLSSPPHTEDRDWHVIIEDAGLAQTFATFLNHDFQVAAQNQATSVDDAATARAVTDAHAKLAAEANPPPTSALRTTRPTYVQPKVFKNISVTIQPLLTPDTVNGGSIKGQYLTNIIDLISKAQQKLYIQLQYIESSSGTGDYNTLLRVIADRVAAGVDVRLIESSEYGEKWAEKMKATGVDLTANISLQPSVHNKGFVVDGSKVVVSSQNFSPAGVEQNRDAGVIIESSDIAKYFEAIFLSDWTNKAKPFAATGSSVSEVRRPRAGSKRLATRAKRSKSGRSNES